MEFPPDDLLFPRAFGEVLEEMVMAAVARLAAMAVARLAAAAVGSAAVGVAAGIPS